MHCIERSISFSCLVIHDCTYKYCNKIKKLHSFPIFFIDRWPLTLPLSLLRHNGLNTFLSSFFLARCPFEVLKYGSEEKGSSLCKCSTLLGYIMSKNLKVLWFYLLIKVQNATSLVFLTKQNPGGWSIYRVKNPSPQIRILVMLGLGVSMVAWKLPTFCPVQKMLKVMKK